MKFQDLKYLLAFSIPYSCYLAIVNQGLWCWATVIYAFVFIPIVEHLLSLNSDNSSIQDYPDDRDYAVYFDLLLYANLPIVAYLLYLGFDNIFNSILTTDELLGKIMSIGVLLGASAINVAHELGHKNSYFSQITSKLLLTPCLYNHFTLQHNRGHHLNVGTVEDPATARRGEMLYAFWIRSTCSAYIQAWRLENSRLGKMKTSISLAQNEMILNTFFTIAYLVGLYKVYDFRIMLVGIAVGVVSFLLLETINYIEHYGLTRNLLPSGRYENVELLHSWNSDHQLGRIILYELTRHADHHYKANKKYQSLLHYEQSPQLPYGYPASMLISLIPSIWFRIIDPLLPELKRIEKAVKNT